VETYILVLDDAPLIHTLLDPTQNLLEPRQVASGDGEGFAGVVVVHEIVADAVAEDHGGVARELGVERLQRRGLGGLVEDGDGGFGFDAGTW
jgi:hypothetical protein